MTNATALSTKGVSSFQTSPWELEELILKIWECIVILEQQMQKVSARAVSKLLGIDKNTIISVEGNGVSGVAIPTTDAEATNVIFGSDILANGGAVLKQTFMSAQSPNCSWDPVSQTLTITGTKLYTQLSQVRGTDEEPVILIRRDSSRQAGLGRDRNWKGLRVLVVYRSRITGGVRRFTREEFRGIL